MMRMSALLSSMSDGPRQEYYLNCAKVALASYELDAMSIHFVQHNAGIVYRLDDANGKLICIKIYG